MDDLDTLLARREDLETQSEALARAIEETEKMIRQMCLSDEALRKRIIKKRKDAERYLNATKWCR